MDSTTICNLALSKIGDQSITSLTDGSLEARFCNLYYPVVLQQCLMLNTWNFATKLANLTRLQSSPIFDWNNQFQLPTDYGRMNQFNSYQVNDPIAQFEIQGQILLTDEATASISYVSTSPDPNTFIPTFIQILSLKLAAELCKPLAGSLELKSSILQEFEKAMAESGKIDANDSRPRVVQPWVNSALVQSRWSGSLA